MKTLTLIALASSFGLLLGATGTLAAANNVGAYDDRQQTVVIADLDLTSRDDAQTLLDRIHAAARQACRRSGAGWSVDQDRFHKDRDHCRTIAYNAGVARIETLFKVDLEAVAGLSPDTNDFAAAR
jgi:UrcA family protein